MDATNEFMTLCWEVVQFMLDLSDVIFSFWYFRLLFVAGLIWIGFDIFEEIANIKNNKED